jgi:type II secretory pathway component GspD/PulD (secretin)
MSLPILCPRKSTRFALAVALAGTITLALPGSVRADPEGESSLDRRVDVALADAAPGESFQSFAQMIGLEAQVDPGLEGKVTVRLRNVRMRTVLDAVCESIGCRWDIVGGSPTKLHIRPVQDPSRPKLTLLDEPIDLKVTKADVRQVLQTFGQIMSAEVDLDPRITGTVSFELDNVPCGKALDKVCAAAGCEWKLEAGKGRMLRITAKK